MRRFILLLAGLLLASALLCAQSLLLVDAGGSTAPIDPLSLKALPGPGLGGLALCAAADGRGLWVSPAGHPRELVLLPAGGGAPLAGPLLLPGALLPHALAADPARQRLWLGYQALNAQGGLDNGLALVDLAGATLAAFARVEGEPCALSLLPALAGQPEQLMLAMALPGTGGALLALAPDLSRVLRSQDLAARPDALRPAELASLPPAPGPAALLAPAAASPTAEPQGDSPAAKGLKSPWQPLKGAFFGQVRDVSGTAMAGARLRALNRRGQALEAVAAADGSYSLGPLSFGSYQVSAEKPGFRKRILSEQILLENARQLDLVLEPAE
jgi:hypothetical protein